jgi:hypothetical protein
MFLNRFQPNITMAAEFTQLPLTGQGNSFEVSD